MRLVSYAVATPLGRAVRIGAYLNGSIVDLTASYEAMLTVTVAADVDGARRIAKAVLPSDMTKFLENGTFARRAAEEAIHFAAEQKRDGSRESKLIWGERDVQLLPPVPRPPTVRDCMAFEAHVRNGYKAIGREVPPEWYQIPAYYKVAPASISGPAAAVTRPAASRWLDFELEYAVVIGRRGETIPAARAKDFIAGYMIYNDFSARDLQAKEMAIGLGPAKGKDFVTGTVIGPYLVTADEIPNPYELKMAARVNGRLITEGRSGDAYWKWEQIIEHISRDEILLPGDIIGSGTVGGGCLLEHGANP